MPSVAAKRSNFASSSVRNVYDNDLTISLIKEMSFASDVTEVPRTHNPGRKVDYKASRKAYKNYLTTCTDVYVFDIEERKKLSI